MAETLNVLKDTPIPTLMIIGGIALLVLSVATHIGNKVTVARERQTWAWIAGALLIVVGTTLYVIEPQESAEKETQTPAPMATETRPAAATATRTASPAATTEALLASDTPAVLGCAAQPRYFVEYWSARLLSLGCPLSANTGGTKITQQPFEDGWMFGHDELLTIWVLLDDHSYETFENTWVKGDDEYSCPELSPSRTPPTPGFGFGRVWCENEGVRQGLGLATDVEQTSNALVQIFERGLIFEVKKQIFLLDEDDGVWEQLK